jgi:methylated-DNA-protein-cysteine methyltransferase-like protein
MTSLDQASQEDERQVSQFAKDVYALVELIPPGRVMSYGQVAALCGSPRSARIVGQVAHWGPPELPWQRVVNRQGRLAAGYTTGGREAQRRDLEAEGVEVSPDYTVDVAALLWWPPGMEPAQQPLFEQD